jgi:osmotically-inducible protein OsmY
MALAFGCAPERGSDADRTADRAAEGVEREGRQGAEGARGAIGDAATTTKVHAQLAADEGLRTLTSINVDTENGVVRLHGEVPTAAAKQRAEEVARKVDGVTSVRNELRVAGGKETERR